MILLDTHTLLWFLGDDEKLPSGIRELIENDTDVFVSIASFWEIAIKNSIGKLPLYCTVTEMMDACFQRGIRLLQIKAEHLELLKDLPKIHGDPFDRLLICQAKTENLLFITKDENIPKYDVRTKWE